VDTHASKELVFHYRPDKILIDADFLFDLPATEAYAKSGESVSAGIATKVFAAIMITSGSAVCQKRMIWYNFSAGDRKGYDESVKRIDKWDFDTMVPSHGDAIEGGGEEIFRKVFQWHL